MKKVDGLWYPDTEERLHRGHTRFTDVKEYIIPHCPNLRGCVQAGGAVGSWVQELCEHFDFVLTFEPNSALIDCLRKNVTAENYFLTRAALWDKMSSGELVEYQPENMGAWYIQEKEDGNIPLVTVDEYTLSLPHIDLIQLDIEGAEYEALLGARNAISAHRPVIVVETKENTQNFYGRSAEDLRTLLREELRYHPHSKFGKDELWLPN